MPRSDSGRSSSADYISGKQGHELADVGNQRREHQRSCLKWSCFAALSIHLEPHFEITDIWNLIRSSEERAQGRKVSALFPFTHWPPCSNWKVALGVVVVKAYPATWSRACSFETYEALFPMTTASSTSQSTLVEFLGLTRSSFGPTRDVVALKKRTGSFGARLWFPPHDRGS